MSRVAIDTYLRPLKPFLDMDGVSEVSINRPQEVWVERLGAQGGMERQSVPELNLTHLQTLSRLIAQFSEQEISEETPLLSATLPEGYRVQVVLPPAVEPGSIGISIRKQALLDLGLDDYQERGAFSDINSRNCCQENGDQELEEAFREGRYREFLEKALLAKKNIFGRSLGQARY